MAPTYNEVRAENESLKAENERLKAVLEDQLETKHGTGQRWIVNVVRHAPVLTALMRRLSPRDECSACMGEYDVHEVDCELVEFWRVTESEHYQPAIDRTFERFCENEQLREQREKYERTRCTAQGQTRCRLKEGHEGAHDFPAKVTLESWNAVAKELYSPAVLSGQGSFFGVDRDAPPTRLTSTEIQIVPPTPVEPAEKLNFFGQLSNSGFIRNEPKPLDPKDPASKIITEPNELRVIENPYVSPGTAYLLAEKSFSFAEGNPADAIRRAKEALDKIAKGEK